MIFSLIITFRNEGEQVYKTCKSFLKYCNPEMFEFIVINDASNDNYDYQELETLPNIIYIENKDRMGVAGSRDIGALKASGKYLFILDAHMRIFEDILTNIYNVVVKFPSNCLFCCQSLPIIKNKEGKLVINKSPQSRACRIDSIMSMNFLEYKWDTLGPDDIMPVLPIQCIMGACYIINKEYYIYLHGLNGLQQYGMDEQFLSAKVYMNGGSIWLLKDIKIAHFYRSDNSEVPYRNINLCKVLNKLIILYLLDKDLFLCYSKQFLNIGIYNILIELKPYLEKESKYLNLILTKKTFKDYLSYGK